MHRAAYQLQQIAGGANVSCCACRRFPMNMAVIRTPERVRLSCCCLRNERGSKESNCSIILVRTRVSAKGGCCSDQAFVLDTVICSLLITRCIFTGYGPTPFECHLDLRHCEAYRRRLSDHPAASFVVDIMLPYCSAKVVLME